MFEFGFGMLWAPKLSQYFFSESAYGKFWTCVYHLEICTLPPAAGFWEQVRFEFWGAAFGKFVCPHPLSKFISGRLSSVPIMDRILIIVSTTFMSLHWVPLSINEVLNLSLSFGKRTVKTVGIDPMALVFSKVAFSPHSPTVCLFRWAESIKI